MSVRPLRSNACLVSLPSAVDTTTNCCLVLSVILNTPFMSGSPRSSTSPLLTEGSSPTFTDVAPSSTSENLRARKFPTPHSLAGDAEVSSKYFRVPVMELPDTLTPVWSALTSVPNMLVPPSSASTVRPKRGFRLPSLLLTCLRHLRLQ